MNGMIAKVIAFMGLLVAVFYYRGNVEKAKGELLKRNIKAARAREVRVNKANKSLHKAQQESKKVLKDEKWTLGDNDNKSD